MEVKTKIHYKILISIEVILHVTQHLKGSFVILK